MRISLPLDSEQMSMVMFVFQT